MLKYYSTLSSLVGIGLFLFYAQAAWCTEGSFLYNAIGNIACTLLISGVLSLLYQIFHKAEEDKKLLTAFNISTAIKKSGLVDIKTDSAQFDFSDIILGSEKFVAIMNDGLRWVGNNSPRLETRFNKRSSITDFYFVNPQSDFCKALANKTNVSLDSLKNKIFQTIELLESTYNKSEKKGSLRIFFLKNYPTQSIFYTENTVIVTPYQTSSGRNIIPLFVYHYKENIDSIGTYLHNDLQNVRLESLLISENGHKIEK